MIMGFIGFDKGTDIWVEQKSSARVAVSGAPVLILLLQLLLQGKGRLTAVVTVVLHWRPCEIPEKEGDEGYRPLRKPALSALQYLVCAANHACISSLHTAPVPLAHGIGLLLPPGLVWDPVSRCLLLHKIPPRIVSCLLLR